MNANSSFGSDAVGGRGRGRRAVPGADAALRKLETGLRDAQQHFADVGGVDVPPAVFFVQGLEEVLDAHEPLRVRHQPELVRPSAEHVGQHFGKPLRGARSVHCLDPLYPFWYFAASCVEVNRARPDGPVNRLRSDGFVKSSQFKARESRVTRRTPSTPKWQRDEAQRRSWAFYEVVQPERTIA